MSYDQIHTVDATSQMIEVSLRSSTTGMLLTGKAYGDMTVKYQREGAASATTVSVVTATKGAYTSGGFIETDIAGLYQFGIPNGALATGAKAVTITFTCTGAIDVVKRIVLVGADLRNANSLGLAYLTGDAFTRLGAPAGASVSADVAAVKSQTSAIETDTQDLQSQIGTAGAGLSAADDAVIAAIAALNNLSSVQAQSAATAALNAYDPPTNAEMEARTLLAANYFDPAADTVARVTLTDTVTTLTDMPAAAPSAADIKTELEADGSKLDHLWEMTADDGGVRQLTAHALELAPTGGSAPTAAAIRAEIDANSTQLASIVADTGTDGVKIHPSQGPVTFTGQVKIIAATVGEGALHITNSGLVGVGMFTQGVIAGSHNKATGASGVGQFNQADGAGGYGQANQAAGGSSAGQYNYGTAADIVGDVTGSITGDVGGKVLGAGAGVFVADGVQVSVSGGGLNAQETADAVNNLAPTSTGATGSIRAKLDAIKLVTDAIDTSAVTVTSTNNSGVLTFTQGVTFAATVSGLTISATWAKLYFTLKESDYDTDDMALIQIVETNPGAGTDGLLYLNSAALVLPIALADGTLTVSQAGGTVAIAITDNAMAQLSKASGLVWDIKTKDAAGATVQNTTGTASITRAITQTI